jgi:predicted nucleic acid-binding protein
MISTVSLAEFLVLIPPERQTAQLAEIQKTFRVCPLDDRAALIAARIRQSTMKSKEIALAYEGRKRLLRVDSLVLAVAIANGVDKLVSYDRGVHAIARAAYPSRHLVMEFPAIEELQFDPPVPPSQSPEDG